MIKIIKIIIVITIIIWWIGTREKAWAVIKRAGNIEVITDEPLFADSIVWYPGLRIEKSFQVKNRGKGAETVQVETENETETKQLARVLTVQIKEGAIGVFGITENKTLRNFFDYGAITLGKVFGDDSGKIFSLAVTMPAAAGNEYQDGVVKFDLRIGFAGESSSVVTVAAGETAGTTVTSTTGESSVVLGKSSAFVETAAGEELGKQEDGGQNPGEVKAAEDNRVRWDFLATVVTVGGILGIGGLAGRIWWRRSR